MYLYLTCDRKVKKGLYQTRKRFSEKPIVVLTVKDILLVSFAITLNHRRTFLLHIYTLACVKAEI